jgi:acylphosphatase
MAVARARIVVRGIVQGVGYRYFAAVRGRAHALNGFVRNMRDGSVEIEAEGERERIEAFVKDVRRGPVSARVTTLDIEWQEPRHRETTFEIR